jgi:hypothetical protein
MTPLPSRVSLRRLGFVLRPKLGLARVIRRSIALASGSGLRLRPAVAMEKASVSRRCGSGQFSSANAAPFERFWIANSMAKKIGSSSAWNVSVCWIWPTFGVPEPISSIRANCQPWLLSMPSTTFQAIIGSSGPRIFDDLRWVLKFRYNGFRRHIVSVSLVRRMGNSNISPLKLSELSARPRPSSTPEAL